MSFDVLREVGLNPQVDPARVAEEEGRLRKEAVAPFDEYNRLVNIQLRWLMARVLTRYDADHKRAEVRWMLYRITAPTIVWTAFDNPSFNEEDWKHEANSRELLLAAIEKLANAVRPYPSTPLTRLRDRLSDRRRRSRSKKIAPIDES